MRIQWHAAPPGLRCCWFFLCFHYNALVLRLFGLGLVTSVLALETPLYSIKIHHESLSIAVQLFLKLHTHCAVSFNVKAFLLFLSHSGA